MAEETAANEKKIYHFTVNLNPVRYAKRFGVEIPDDSSDMGLTGDADKSESPSEGRKRGSESAAKKTDNDQSGGEVRAQDGADGLVEVDGEDAEPTTICQLPTNNSSVIAEDATVDYGKRMAGTMAGQCAATLQQCKAKNPLTCRYHGAKVIAHDIEALLRRQGVKGQVTVELQNVTKQGRKELLSAQVEIVGTKKEAKLVTKAMQAFANLPGVDSVEDGDYESKRIYTGFDIDILDPKAQANWGAAQAAQAQAAQPTPAQQPAPQPATPATAPQPTPAPQPQPQPQPQPTQQQPQPTPQPPTNQPANQPTTPAAPLHPIAPPKPQAAVVPDFTQQDLDDLTAGRDRLEPALKLLNGHAGDTNYITNSSRFPGLYSVSQDTAFFKRLDDLSKNKDAQVAAAAQTIKTVADAIAASRAAGWATKPGMMLDDAATFQSKLPTVQDIPEQPKSEEEKREPDVNMAKALKKSTDQNAPKSAADALLAAHDLMTDMENDVEAFDDALKNEKDPDNKAGLKEAVDALDAAYGAAKKMYDDAKAAIDAWMNDQRTMATDAYTYADVKAHFTRLGLKVPMGAENWEKWVKDHEKDADAVVAREFGSRKGWTTQQERQDRVKQLRKNAVELFKHIHIFHAVCSPHSQSYVKNNLETHGSVKADVTDYNYKRALHNAFGAKGTPTADDMQLYTVLSIESNPKKCDWGVISNCDFIVELDPKKTIGGVNFSNACGYWDQSCGPGAAMGLLSQVGLTDIAYAISRNGAQDFNPKAAEVDFAGMDPTDMFDLFFPHGSSSMEFHPVNGASYEQQNLLNIFTGTKLGSKALAQMKKHGVKNISLQTLKEYP